MQTKIWALSVWDHRDTNITLWEDEKDAINALADFVRSNWDEGFIEDHGEFDSIGASVAIDHFFADSSIDYYSLELITLNKSKNQ